MSLSFEEFRAKLADEVTNAINAGARICVASEAASDTAYCPLGALAIKLNARWTHPWPNIAADAWGLSLAAAAGFARGFDGVSRCSTPENFYELGRAYRRRFVEGVRR
jgi:hypothetical protein